MHSFAFKEMCNFQRCIIISVIVVVLVALSNSELIVLSKKESDQDKQNGRYTFTCVAEGKDVNSTIAWFDKNNLPLSKVNPILKCK